MVGSKEVTLIIALTSHTLVKMQCNSGEFSQEVSW